MEDEGLNEKKLLDLPIEEKSSDNTLDNQSKDEGEPSSKEKSSGNTIDNQSKNEGELPSAMKLLNVESSSDRLDNQCEGEQPTEMKLVNIADKNPDHQPAKGEMLNEDTSETACKKSENEEDENRTTEEIPCDEKEVEPVFDGTETPGMEVAGTLSGDSLDNDQGAQGSAWPEKAVAIKNFVREKSAVAVSSVIRRLSSKGDEDGQALPDSQDNIDNSTMGVKEEEDTSQEIKAKEVGQQTGERSAWNPLNFIRIARNLDLQNKTEQGVGIIADSAQVPAMKGRVTLYTRLGCQICREVRKYLHQKGLKYIEINIDIYPSRKVELEKTAGSSAVPRVFFDDLLIGGLSELKAMDESGELEQKINDLINNEPSSAAPLPPLSGEDDVSGTGTVDELAVTVRKMRESIICKDRFYKMRRFTNCFLGSEAVDFLSEDQYLEREEAVEFGRKLAKKYFFRHVLDENVCEDGNHVYRFLDHDPIVSSQCFNFPRGTIDVKPKPIVEISSRLRFLMFAIFEAYVSDDGRHVDYQSIRATEEFARYLRIVEELQRVDFQDLSREEKLAFFINLFNMMTIHAILTWGYPAGALERRKLLGDFKYVIGGYTYSLSAIENGILRGNQRPPYNLIKPFGARDMRSKVALPYPEPLIHFALVCGTRSGPALRCYSPGDIDKELMEAARDFLRNGGLVVDVEAKLALVSKILRWYSADFGKNEVEVMKHVSNYLEPEKSSELLELLANAQLKVTYQSYDWSLNC